MRRARAWTVAIFALSCEGRTPEEPPIRAEFGVFFGGQIQERSELPFELDRAKQSQGFRIELTEPSPADLPVRWELTMPGTNLNVRDDKTASGKARVTILGNGTLRAGQRRFEHSIAFRPGDPLGLWNLRVVVESKVLIDRPFTVYDPSARARALVDGGSPP